MGRRLMLRVACEGQPGRDTCGWTGNTTAIEEHGAFSMAREECPVCGGTLEVLEDRDAYQE